MRAKGAALGLGALLLLSTPRSGNAAEIYVTSGGPVLGTTGACNNPHPSIAKAVANLEAPPKDNTIWLRAMTMQAAPAEPIPEKRFFETVTIDNKSVTIRPYRQEANGTCNPTDTKVLIKIISTPPPGIPPANNGKPGVLATNGANVHLRHLIVYGQQGAVGLGTNADGGKGGPGVRAEGGSTLTKLDVEAKGGRGGRGSNHDGVGDPNTGGSGADGGEGEESKDANTRLRNFKARVKGGDGGAGGDNNQGPGGGGGNGGAGAKTSNGGTIERTPSSAPQGGNGAPGGTGTPPGSPGAPGASESGSLIITIPEGDFDSDGTIDTLDPCIDDPSPGCLPSGACTVNLNTCVVVRQAECGTFGGVYAGDGSDCPESSIPYVDASIPALSMWGQLALAGVLGSLLILVIKRRMRPSLSV